MTTVKELQDAVQTQAGSTKSKKDIRVLFGGKQLEPTDILSQVGVSDGSQLNMVPSTQKSSSTKSNKAKSSTVAAASSSETGAATASSSAGSNPMEDFMKQAGVDTSQLDEIMKGMGGADGKQPTMQESIEMMGKMMNSPVFQEFMNDPEQLEKSRQMILNNPMLKGMMTGMPGMSDILNDPNAWREAMQAAASMYKNMDPETLMNMMGGAGGMGMPPGAGSGMGGLFDGTLDDSAAASALDELDEDEE